MSYVTPHWITPSTGTPSSLILKPSLSEHKPCGDLRPQLSGALAEPRPFTGSEPKQLAENRDYKHSTEGKQLTEHEDLRVRRPTIQRKASRHRAAESDLDDFFKWTREDKEQSVQKQFIRLETKKD